MAQKHMVFNQIARQGEVWLQWYWEVMRHGWSASAKKECSVKTINLTKTTASQVTFIRTNEAYDLLARDSRLSKVRHKKNTNMFLGWHYSLMFEWKYLRKIRVKVSCGLGLFTRFMRVKPLVSIPNFRSLQPLSTQALVCEHGNMRATSHLTNLDHIS